MVGRTLTVVGVAFLLVPVAWGGGPVPLPPVDSGNSVGVLTTSLSTPSPGRSVALTLRLHAELQCGRIAARTLTVRLPGAMRVPQSIARTAVRVGGAVPASVATTGSSVHIRVSTLKAGAAICDVLGPGAFPVVFTAQAGLRNPVRPGTYALSVTGSPRGIWRGAVKIASS